MSSNESRRSRLTASLLAVSAATAMTAVFAVPAGATSGQGEATIVAAKNGKGRTLSGQGVKLIAGPGAASQNAKLILPITEVSVGTPPTAAGPAALGFKRGKKTVTLTAIRFDLQTSSLLGKLGGGDELSVFKLGGSANVSSTAIALSDGKLQLTAEGASALKQKLGLERNLLRKGVGTVWLDARLSPAATVATPAPKSEDPPAKDEPKRPYADPLALLGGSADWGVLASWRSYIYANMGPGSVGSITLSDGATQSGDLSEPSSFIGFSGTSGAYEKGLEGNADRLTMHTAGTVKFAKPGHCIIEVKLSDLELTIDGANSGIELDSVYDIDTPAGMACTDVPAVPTTDVDFASLDVSGVTPSHAGKAITWANVPATLTAAGSAAWGSTYPAGKELDPVTISVETE
jgi:hypothetical protein